MIFILSLLIYKPKIERINKYINIVNLIKKTN
jgi:hypothetical protein